MLKFNNKIILVTGCAGFIGFHAAKKLLEKGCQVVGLDNLNHYYDVNLKLSRLNILKNFKNFIFEKLDLKHHKDITNLSKKYPEINLILHLAAQAGVRYSLMEPFAYTDSNIAGHLAILELARKLLNLKHLVYASSSSVYGANTKLPFDITDRVDHPISLYAATKRSCELMSYCYQHLFGIKTTGLRFFTVYGPWGRPDMSAFIFTKAILNNQKIPVYNNGDMRRNFTYIDDIISGTISCLFSYEHLNYNIYNLGNNRSENLMDFIQELELHLEKKAELDLQPMQLGDVKETVADITAAKQDFDFSPSINIKTGLKHFITWYKDYYALSVSN
jgi:UDP-glucuronate 4-epimerase